MVLRVSHAAKPPGTRTTEGERKGGAFRACDARPAEGFVKRGLVLVEVLEQSGWVMVGMSCGVDHCINCATSTIMWKS